MKGGLEPRFLPNEVLPIWRESILYTNRDHVIMDLKIDTSKTKWDKNDSLYKKRAYNVNAPFLGRKRIFHLFPSLCSHSSMIAGDREVPASEIRDTAITYTRILEDILYPIDFRRLFFIDI